MTSRHCTRRCYASDFDNISKEILTTATSIFRCLVVTRAPFPDTIAVETKLAKEAWREAGQIKGTNVKLTPTAVKILLKCTSHVRGELKTKMRTLTHSFFGFRSSDSREVIRHNRDLAESLKEGSAFVFKDWTMKKGIYKTELLQEGINIMWFVNRRFHERTAPYKLLERICDNLLDTARFHAGVDAPTASSAAFCIDDEAFEDAIREHQLEEERGVDDNKS
ncbi:hypothetical protein DFH29DRAFT_969451 [Suillus ampliporus]|nr:hypothetical protein DFH29DRAFT_969451 [Suillus ampliporus]